MKIENELRGMKRDGSQFPVLDSQFSILNYMKKLLPDLIAILAFIILSFAYFFPADIEGRILFQHDSVAGVGAGQESKEYRDRTGERTRWTNAIFGGMPTYQMSPSYDSTKPLNWVEKVYRLYLPDYVVLTFIMMLGLYILLRAFGISAWLAALGGVIWAFSSYFFILISAGHIWKFVTLAYIYRLRLRVSSCPIERNTCWEELSRLSLSLFRYSPTTFR